MKNLPTETERSDLEYQNIQFLLPSFHCNAHGLKCIRLYHRERNPAVGLCDGEASERNWSQLIKIEHIVKNQAAENRILQIQDQLWFLHQRSENLDFVLNLIKKRTRLLKDIPSLLYVSHLNTHELVMTFSL
jgi:hypothetical protein